MSWILTNFKLSCKRRFKLWKNFYVLLLQEGKTAKIEDPGKWELTRYIEQINSYYTNTVFLFPPKK